MKFKEMNNLDTGGGGILPIVGYTRWLQLKGVPFLSCSISKGREKCHFSMRKGYKNSCKVEEMVAKAKYIKGCHILAEMTMQQGESECLKTREKRGDYRKFFCFGLSLRYKKGMQFCSRYMKGEPFW